MIFDYHYDHVGVTLYVDEKLTHASALDQLRFITNLSYKEMEYRLNKYHEDLWWGRFLKYCQTGE